MSNFKILDVTSSDPNEVQVVIAYTVIAIIGGFITFVFLLPYNFWLAFLAVPFGGSFLVFILALLVAVRISRGH
jgi:type IV secretory pathway VirB3-like protein